MMRDLFWASVALSERMLTALEAHPLAVGCGVAVAFWVAWRHAEREDRWQPSGRYRRLPSNRVRR